MKRILRAQTLAWSGLFCGLIAGIAVLLSKQWLVQQIVSALEEEVQASCDCSLTFDSLSLSFLTLSGSARNVRIVERGANRLSFKKISVDIDLVEIKDKRIHLKNLTLIGGIADGVGPDSVTFRFIDQLTTPLPPEKQRPNRWRVILDSLFIKQSFLRESFGTSELSGSGVTMKLLRENTTFHLSPSIKDFRYTTYSHDALTPSQELYLGNLQADLTIQNSITSFRSLSLGRAQSSIQAQANSDGRNNHALAGALNAQIEGEYLGLPTWLEGIIRGEGTIGGSLGSPTIKGTLHSDAGNPLTIALPNASSVPLHELVSNFFIDVNHGYPTLSLSNISGSVPDGAIHSKTPLTLSNEGLKASFSIRLPSFSYGPFRFSKLAAILDTKEIDGNLHTEISIKSDNTAIEDIALGPSTITIDLTPSNANIKLLISNPLQGKLSWSGSIDMTDNEPLLKSGLLSLESYRYLSSYESRIASSIALTAKNIATSGPLDIKRLRAEGLMQIDFSETVSPLVLKGNSSLENGFLTIGLSNATSEVSADLRVSFHDQEPSALNITIPPSTLNTILPLDDTCGRLGGRLSYNFGLNAPTLGSGKVVMDSFVIGCAPHTLELKETTTLSVEGGTLNFPPLVLEGKQSSLATYGTISAASGFDLSLKGSLDLASLIYLAPDLENLEGTLKIDALAKGAIGNPDLQGNAQLSQGRFGLSSPDVEAHEIRGDFIFEKDFLRVKSLNGIINGGSFSSSGIVYPFDWNHSALKATLEEVSIEPEEDTSITFSGELALDASSTQKQTLSGDISIIFAEVSKEFDINKILLKTISGYFLPTRVRPQTSSSPIDIALDINLSAARNVFISSPFLSAELNTNLHASGTTSNPSLDGSMQFLSGWIGLKGNRFDINSGALTFIAPSLTPQISLSSEGALRASTGESITVLLEATGPLPSPKITLASDGGLSQNELLLILTSSRPIGESSLKARMNSGYGAQQRLFKGKGPLTSLRSFFQNLTRLDVLSFEPAYNQFSGAIEPAIVARKNISPRFNLVGESLFSSVSNSKAGGVFALTPSIDLNAFFQTVSTQKNSIISSDITFTILAKQSTLISYEIEGNDSFRKLDLLTAARLSPSSRIENSFSTLNLIEKQIVTFLSDRGYRHASAKVTCKIGEKFCQELKISIQEGAPSTVLGIVFDGDPLPATLVESIKHSAPLQGLATTEKLREIEENIVIALRNEGYIAARVSANFLDEENKPSAILRIKTDLQRPISFVFNGNKVFSAKDFLSSINLFTRKRAFGNNTINLLIQNIEQMYLMRGHLFVEVAYTEERDTKGRITYYISINEDSPIVVKNLSLQGNNSLSREKLKERMRSLGYDAYIEALSSKYAIPNQLDSLRDVIQEIYEYEGFPSVDVRYQILPSIAASNLEIEYKISEGKRIRASKIQVSGTPESVLLPPLPILPASLPQLNAYVQVLVSTLNDYGYRSSTFTTDFDSTENAFRINATPGPQTYIGDLKFYGLGEISQSTVQQSVSLHADTPLHQKEIDETKRELLRTGLFSRVEVGPSDGDFDTAKEDIAIRVTERPLQTLEVGLGANSEFGLHTFGEASDKSLFKDGRTITLRADTYFDQSRINPSGSGIISQGFTSLRFVDPTILHSTYTLTEELRYQRQELSTQEFNLDRLLLGSYIFRQLDPTLTVTAGHSLMLDNPQDVNPDAIISDLDAESLRLSFLSGVMKLDERDDPLLPSRGYTFTLEPKITSQVIGSEASFLSALARSSLILPLSMRYSLGVSINGGIAQALGATDEVPITQRFYLGGRTTVRGFRENSLGPRGANGAVIGGNAMISTKLELQHRTLDSLSTHLFFDAGNVFLRGYDNNDYTLRKSVGAGFQYLSPIGPLGFDIGHPLDEKSGEPSVRIHFSVGSMF